MIKKEEFKEGLEFVLPYSEFKDEEDEKEYIRCLVRHGFDGVSHWKNAFYTKIQFYGKEYTLKIRKRPVFEVIDKVVFENYSISVKNKNASITDDVFMLIDFSFVEKFGEKVVKKQKIKRRNKGRDKAADWDIPYLGKYSIRLDCGGVGDDISTIAKIKKEDEENTDCFLDFLDKAIDSWTIEALCNDSLCKCIESINQYLINQYLKEAHPEEDKSEADSNKEGADRFKEITDKMLETYKSKNKDYGDSFHKLFEECGMTYAYGHLAEKLERINSLRKNEAKVKGESMKDSLYDLANYAILTIIELEKTEK